MSTTTEPSARNRIAISFVVLYLLWVVVVLVAGEVNLASLVLGAVLAALIVWMGERRHRRNAPTA